MTFRYALIPPDPALCGWVNTFYVIETDAAEVPETIPAYSAQALVIVKGALRVQYADGTRARATGISINAPQLRSAACVLEGPMQLVGASLTPIGWQAVANLPVDEVHDRMFPGQTVLTPEQMATLAEAAERCGKGEIAPREVAALLGQAIAAAPYRPRADHAAVAEAITQWLGSGFDPPLSALYAKVDLSARQLQRLSRRFFGVPPAQVLKRFRAIRAAMLLANPGLSPERREEMILAYFDQAHLIRDIRRYTGRTPTGLRTPSLSAGLLDPAAHGNTAAFLQPPD